MKYKIIYHSILLICLFSTIKLEAKTNYYVKLNGTSDGSSWANASGNIQTMINAAVAGDEVWIEKGIYFTGVWPNNSRSSVFTMKDGVSIFGGFAGTETDISQRIKADIDKNGKIDSWEFVNTTILSGDIDGVPDTWALAANPVLSFFTVRGNEGNSYCVVRCSPFNNITYFNGFTVTGGNNDNSSGGGIYAQKNSVISNCIVTKSSARFGGGIYSDGIVKNCFVYNCSAALAFAISEYTGICGGGICSNQSVSNCIINDCTASGPVSLGGGIYANGTTDNCIINNCSAQSNYATASGGGICSTSIVNNCLVTNCAVSCNDQWTGSATTRGGGIYSVSAINNCTVSNCSITSMAFSSSGGITAAVSYGGGICSEYNVINCAINNCYSYAYPRKASIGGIYSAGSVNNCVAINNYDDNTLSNVSALSELGNLFPDLSITYLKPSSFIGVASTDAQKTELQSVNWHLKSGSSSINAGTSIGIPYDILMGNDIDGLDRMQGGTIDIGAYEYNSSYTITVTANPVEGGSVTGAGSYLHGTSVSLTASSEIGYKFNNWTENGTVVSTNATYVFSATTNRSLVANYSSNVGIEESDKNEVSFYPNPARERITLSFSNALIPAVDEIKMFNSSGVLVYKTSAKDLSESLTINLHGFKPGAYNLLISDKTSNSIRSFKIIVIQ